jgi:hypothetical protein
LSAASCAARVAAVGGFGAIAGEGAGPAAAATHKARLAIPKTTGREIKFEPTIATVDPWKNYANIDSMPVS